MKDEKTKNRFTANPKSIVAKKTTAMPEKLNWSSDLMQQFIEVYKKHPALWRNQTQDYYNKPKKQAGYEALIDVVRGAYPDADKHFVQKKIQYLRNSFRKTHQQLIKAANEGKENFKPQLQYYKQLKFLLITGFGPGNRKQAIKKETETTEAGGDKSKFNTLIDEYLGDAPHEWWKTYNPDSPSRMFVSPKPPTHSANNMTLRHLEPETSLTEVNAPQVNCTDEFYGVGINVCAKLHKMGSPQQIHAELLINRILTKGLLGTLNENIDIVDNSFH